MSLYRLNNLSVGVSVGQIQHFFHKCRFTVVDVEVKQGKDQDRGGGSRRSANSNTHYAYVLIREHHDRPVRSHDLRDMFGSSCHLEVVKLSSKDKETLRRFDEEEHNERKRRRERDAGHKSTSAAEEKRSSRSDKQRKDRHRKRNDRDRDGSVDIYDETDYLVLGTEEEALAEKRKRQEGGKSGAPSNIPVPPLPPLLPLVPLRAEQGTTAAGTAAGGQPLPPVDDEDDFEPITTFGEPIMSVEEEEELQEEKSSSNNGEAAGVDKTTKDTQSKQVHSTVQHPPQFTAGAGTPGAAGELVVCVPYAMCPANLVRSRLCALAQWNKETGTVALIQEEDQPAMMMDANAGMVTSPGAGMGGGLGNLPPPRFNPHVV